MPAFIAALLGGLLSVSGSLIGRILLQLGIGAVIYTGLDVSLSWLRDQAIAYLVATGTHGGVNVVALLAYMKVGVSISIISSALLAKLTLNGAVSGTKKVLRLS